MDERRDARAQWPIRRTTLEEADADRASDETTTPEERLAMMWDLAVECWRLAGREIPVYERSEMPTRIIRPDES